MRRLALVNPPFGMLGLPSLALTQLSGRLRTGPDRDRVTVTEHYINLDIAKLLGVSVYTFIANAGDASGLGEWMFRRLAFPELVDNPDEYFDRYHDRFPAEGLRERWRGILDLRAKLGACVEAAVDKHRLTEADIVGFTSMFTQTCASIAVARAIKAKNPSAIVVIGGANCEAPMGEPLAQHVPCLDYVFSGPGLVSFPEFVTHVLDGRLEACEAIAGVIPAPHRRGTMAASTAPAACASGTVGKDLDIDVDIPLDYSTFLNSLTEQYPDGRLSPTLLFETSRGCWWGEKAHCTFCGLNGTTMHYRAMRPAKSLELFNELFSLAPTVMHLQAVDNILPRSYLTEVLPFLQPPPGVAIFYEVKADMSARELKLLARSGVTRIQPGIESLATSTLQLMKKGTSAHQNIEFLKNCALNHIEPGWNLLIGFPGEDEGVYAKYVTDLPLFMHLPPPSGVYPIRFDRYSPYFTRAAEYGLKLAPVAFYELVYPFPREALTDLAYYFVDETADPPYSAAVRRWFDRLHTLVERWRELWTVTHTPTRPILQYESVESTVVLDSRSGGLVKHDVGDAGRSVLRGLTKARRASDLVKLLPQYDAGEIGSTLRRMRDLALLFEEGERYLSLVVVDDAEELPTWPPNKLEKRFHVVLHEWR